VSPYKTMIKSTKPVIGICAVRTGCGMLVRRLLCP
jgi:predicted GTPase